MIIEVVYEVRGSVCTDKFTCSHGTVQIDPDFAKVTLVDGRDKHGRKVTDALYRFPQALYRYDED